MITGPVMTWDNQAPDSDCDWCTGMSGWPHPGPHMRGGNALKAKEDDKAQLAALRASAETIEEDPEAQAKADVEGAVIGGVEIQLMPIDQLKPAPYNPRSINVDALRGLGRSIDEFGLVEPIVWNRRTGHVVGGHQRLEALIERGVTETPVVVVDIDETREKALNVSLNNPNIQGVFTPDLGGILALLESSLPNDLFLNLKMDMLHAGPVSVADFDPVMAPENKYAGPRQIKCPECGHAFEL
jgi:hypothetical protein